jgi:hypothetical protein
MRRRGSDGGQATVELALVLPLLVVLLLAVIQVALVARDRVALSHASREAARVAVEAPAAGPVGDAARDATGLDPSRLDVGLSGGGQPGDRFTVEVRYRVVTDVMLVGRLFPDFDLIERFVGRVG